MKLIRWSVDNPAAVLALYFGIFLAAVLVEGRILATRMMPYVESPMIGIISQAPAMSPEEVETYISKPIEERMVDIAGVRYIRSTSTQGMSVVSLEFPYGYDMKKALTDVQNLMSAAQADLPYDPANLRPPWILPIDPLNLPVLKLALTAPDWDPIELREFADNTLVTRLKRADNVESVYAFGGYKRQAQVVVDRDRLAAYGLSILGLRRAVDGANVDRSAGTLTWMEEEQIVRLASRALSGEQLADVVLGSFQGRPVYLRDVAQAQDTHQERRSLYRFNGEEAIEINIIQRPGSSSPDTIASVREELQKLGREYPSLHFEEAYDNAYFVGVVKQNMYKELALGVVLTGLVLLLFLGNTQGTLVAVVSIPTSLAAAVLLFYPFGLSLNSSTLIGLLIAIGRLVDDAIIAMHSIERHLAMGKSARDAAIDGCSEIHPPLIASNMMTCLIMLPLTFSGGLTQVMFEGIVWPYLFCVLTSLGVALTLTPLMASIVYRNYDPSIVPKWKKPLLPWYRALERMQKHYGRLLEWALGNRGFVMSLAGIAVYMAVSMFPLIGYEMMPLADVGQAYAVMETRPGTSFAETAEKAKQLESILLEQPEIEKVSLRVGFEPGGTYFSGYGMGGITTVNIMLTFSDLEDRKRSIWEVIDAVYEETTTTISGIRRLAIKEMGSDVMASSMAPIELLVYGPDLTRLSWLAEETKKIMEEYPDIHQPATAWSMELPELRLEIDQRKAAEIGLTPAEVAEQAYYALAGGSTREFFNPPKVRKSSVLIRYEESQRKDLADVENVIIAGAEGVRVPLKSLAEISEHMAPAVIARDGLRRVNSVLGYYRQGGPGSMQLTMDVMMDSLMRLPYPPGYGMEQRGDMTQMMDSFDRLLKGIALALVFVYLALIVQFRSVSQPLTMTAATLPLEMIGVFGGLYLAGQTFSTVSILGILVLFSMDITASILLVERIQTNREGGLPRREAVCEAGPVRLLPISMTVLVTIVVLLPVALFPKTGMDAYAPLATVIVGGLAFSTVLTLLIVPVLYTLMDDLEGGLLGLWGRLRGTRSTTTFMVLLLFFPLSTQVRAEEESVQVGLTPDKTFTSEVPEEFCPAGFPVLSGHLRLERALELALEHSLPLAVARSQLEASQSDVLRASSEGRIKLSVGGYLLWSAQPTMWGAAPNVYPPLMTPVSGDNAAFLRANLMYPLFTGGLLEARLQAAKEGEKLAIAEVATAIQKLLYRVRVGYYGLLLARRQVEVAQWRVSEQQEVLRIFEEQLETGRVAGFVVYRSRAELADAQQQYNSSLASFTVAEADLKAAMGVSVVSPFTYPEILALPERRATDLETDILLGLSERPDLVASRHGVVQALYQVEAVEAEYRPQVYLGVQYQGVATRPLNAGGGPYDGGFSGGVSVALPILDGGDRRARLNLQKANAETRRLQLREAELEVARQVAASRARWDAANKNAILARHEVHQAEEDLRIARLRNQLGRSIHLEILDALEATSRARMNLLAAQHDAAVAHAELLLATGESNYESTDPGEQGENEP